ncbi:MAG: CRISPR-associated helicase Cas3' [Clostridiales bacterium]
MKQPYYAHKTDDGRKQRVKEHCENVAEIAKNYAASVKIENTAYLAGLYHDIGKNSLEFQTYLDQNNDILSQTYKKINRGDIDHSYAGAKFLYENLEKDTPIKMFLCELLAITIGSHHGLYDWLKLDGEDYFSKRLAKNHCYGEIQEECRKSYLSPKDLTAKFLEAEQEITNFTEKIAMLDKHNKHFYYGMLVRLLLSILIDADRNDTISFTRHENLPGQLGNMEIWEQIQKNLDITLKKLKSDDFLSQKKQEISDVCYNFAKKQVGIYQLIVPTGGGKTLSSLRFAIEHAKIQNMNHIYYIAPFNTILEQNSDVFSNVIKDNNLFLEHHCNVENDSEEYELLTQTWNCPVIATTMVQFLNALFSDKTSAVRRMHQLTNSVIIVDEIQSIPIKCIGLFNLAMNFLSKLGNSTIILCSATQPTLDNIEHSNLIFSEPKSIIENVDVDFANFKRTNIVDLTPEPKNNDQAADFLYKTADENHNVLLVVNTKKAAKDIYDLLLEKQSADKNKEKYHLIHLSTNMCPGHRQKVLAKMIKSLAANEHLICVTTQLIEAGVNISFNCVVRSLAGLDNIAQAAGRCNRNGKYKCKNVYVIKLTEENIGKLPEIKEAQIATNLLLRNTEYYKDILSPQAMDMFYEKYYLTLVKDGKMNYILPHEKTSIMNLLSFNNYARDGYITRTGHIPPHIFCQGFKTAGGNFDVIENNTMAIIVPYNEEAKEIISQLSSQYYPCNFKAIQKYTISVYPHIFEKLKSTNSIYTPLNSGIWILREENYDEKSGLIIEANLMDFDSI